jgi:2-dehydro-3-deoxyphosphogluconate aldolase / (4S)-4-hydroxy-2-oxoglutarate aldolase
MSFTREHIVGMMKSTGMIPVFYHADIEVARNVIDASYKGGVRVFEFTNRGENAFEVFTKLLKHIEKYPDLILGIGTILDASTARKFINAGAHFIVSPILKIGMASVCHQLKTLWIPGCATLTEVVNAKEAGAEVIKLFPGSVLGPQFVSSVMPVVPGLQLMPTGGVEPTEKNLSEWFDAGVVCVGMGSQLLKKEIILGNKWEQLQREIADAFALINRIRIK